MVQTGPGLGDGGGVAEHGDGTLHPGQVTARHNGRGLVVDAYLEASRAPVHELDGTLGFDGGDCSVDILGDNVAAEQETAGHVLAVTGVALHHLAGRIEARVGQVCHTQLLVVGLLGGDDGSVGGQREVDARIRHQVGLELRQIHVESAVEAQRSGDRGHDLTQQSVQVGIRGTTNVQISSTQVVDGFVVHHEGAVGVLQRSVRGQDRVVGLYHRGRNLRGWIDRKLQLRPLAVVHAEPLHEQGGKARARAAPEAVEDEEPLQPLAVLCDATDLFQHEVDDLLADGVVTAGVVVGGVLLASHQLVGVKQLTVGAGSNLV